jgi:putative hydrolase of the HAD superfamily
MAAANILAGYSVLLLDINGTFMFNQDRFGPDQDFYATYRAVGGTKLSAQKISSAVTACVRKMSTIYEDPGRHDTFPSVQGVLSICRNART